MSANDRGNEPTDDATSSSRQRPARPVATARRDNGSVDPREELVGKRPPSRNNTNSKRRPSNGSSANGAGSNGAGSNGAGSNGAGSNGAGSNGSITTEATPTDAIAADAIAADATATDATATDATATVIPEVGRSRSNTNSKRRPTNGAGSNGSTTADAIAADAIAADATVTDASATDATATVIPEVGRLAPVELPDRPAGPVKPRARQKQPRTTTNPVVPGRPERLVDPMQPIPMPMPIPMPTAPPERSPIQPSHLAPMPQPIVIHPSAQDYGAPSLQFDETEVEPEGPPPSRRVPRLSPGGRRTRPRVRRVTRVVRHVDPWSVFKVALCFSMVLYGVCLTAGVLLWNVAYTTGTIENMQRFFESFGWTSFRFKGGELFHNAWIAGLFAAVGLTGLIVLAATLFNLITDLVGGIRVTVLEEEVVERNPALTQPLLRRRSSEMSMIRARRRGDDDGAADDDTTGPTGHQPG